MADLWVFGYGSLIWNPGFAFVEAVKARASGYARRFSLESITYRGTPERPGLVLSLDPAPEASCHGLAYRVAAGEAEAAHAYLRERELVTYAYQERRVPLALEDGRRVEALTYVTDPAHPQHCGAKSLEDQAEIIATAAGPAGTNRDYLDKTLAHLGALGIEDEEITRLAALVAAHCGRAREGSA